MIAGSGGRRREYAKKRNVGIMNGSDMTKTAEIAEWTINRAKSLGADSAAAEVCHDRGLSVTVRAGDVDAVEHTEERVLSLSVWVGKRRGCASTSDLSEAALDETVRAAVDIAKVSAEDPATGLPDEADLQTTFRDLDLWHPFEGTAEEAVELAARAEEAAFAADDRIVNSDGTNFSTSSGEFTLANTLGFMAGYRYSRHDLDCAPIAEDESGMQRDGWWTQGRRLSDMLAPEEVGRIAGERAAARLGAGMLANRRANVMFDASVATGLLDILEELLSGRAWYRHASCLEGRLGEVILPRHISVEENPYLPGAIGSGVFDDEGCAGTVRRIVDEGRLEGLFLSSYSARKLGMRTTGNLGGAYTLTLTSTETRPEDTREAMLARLGTGFLVTELIGQGLNSVTGDYSRGAAGFWVENGRIVAPVEGVTIASNILTMMRHIEAVGSDVYDGCRRTGSLIVSDLMLAGEA